MDNHTRQALQKIIKSRLEDDKVRCNIFGSEFGDVIGFDPFGKYIAVKLGDRNTYKELKTGVRLIEASSFENFLKIYLTKHVPTEQVPQTLF